MFYGFLLIQIFLIITINIIFLIFSTIASDFIFNMTGILVYCLLIIPLIQIIQDLRLLIESNNIILNDYIYIIIRTSIFIELLCGVFLFIESVLVLIFS